MDGLQPEHVDTHRRVVIFIQRVGTPVEAARFAGQRGIIDQIEERAASVDRGVLGLDDERVDLIHVQGKGFLGGDHDSAVSAQSVVGIVDVVVVVDAGYFVANLQAVGAAKVDRQGRGVEALHVRAGHGVGAEVGIRRRRNRGGIFFEHGKVAAVKIGEDFHLGRRHDGVGFEFDDKARGFLGYFIEIEAAQTVVAIGFVAADGHDHFRIADIEASVEILIAQRCGVEGLKLGNLDVVGLISEGRRSLADQIAAVGPRVSPHGDVNDFRHRTEHLQEVDLGFHGLALVTQQESSGDTEAVGIGARGVRPDPRFGLRGEIEFSINPPCFGPRMIERIAELVGDENKVVVGSAFCGPGGGVELVATDGGVDAHAVVGHHEVLAVELAVHGEAGGGRERVVVAVVAVPDGGATDDRVEPVLDSPGSRGCGIVGGENTAGPRGHGDLSDGRGAKHPCEELDRGSALERTVIGFVGDIEVHAAAGDPGVGRGGGPRDVDFGLFSGEADVEGATADVEGVAGVEGVDEDRAVGLADRRLQSHVAVGGVEGDEGLFLVEDAAERVRTLAG